MARWAGAFSSDAIAETDLERGRYDGARVEVLLVNWADPAQFLLEHVREIGEVTRTDNSFRAELRGLAARLDQPTGRVYGRRCDARLGDGRCKVNVTSYRRAALWSRPICCRQGCPGYRLCHGLVRLRRGDVYQRRARRQRGGCRRTSGGQSGAAHLLAATAGKPFSGRYVRNRRRLRQGFFDLQGEVRQRIEFSRLSTHAGLRFRLQLCQWRDDA